MNNAVVSLFANLGTNICLCSKQALPGCVINRLIKPAVMSRITANYDKICFGVSSGKKQWSVYIYLGVHYCHHHAPECTEYAAGGGGEHCVDLCKGGQKERKHEGVNG